MVALFACLVLLQNSGFIPTWTGLAAKYEYKHLGSTDVSNLISTTENGAIRTTFTYSGTPGDTVHAELVEPVSSKPVPVVILLQGLGGSGSAIGRQFGKKLLDGGIGYADIDAPGHGERATNADKKVMQSITKAFLSNKGDLLKSMMANDPDLSVTKFLERAVIDGVKDNRRLLDFLMARPDVDYHHVGVIGVSLGSITGAILGPVDRRVKAMLLEVGGDPTYPFINSVPAELRDSAIATSCSLYAPKFLGPVRMLNGLKDSIIPRDATDRLFTAFPEGLKSISWYNSDHFLPALADEEAVQWITDRMKD